VDVGTRGVRKIISGGVNTYPSYSPDGRRIVFRKMIGEGNSEVFVAEADGSHEINLTRHPAFDGWPAWSPDGRRIAFASNREGNYQIYIMNADGSDVRLLVRSEARGTAPKWTPDARRIFFPICRSVDGVGHCEIFAANVPEP
jgi:TolB protein